MNFISEMTELIYSIGADENLISSIIEDGHYQAFEEIENKKARILLLDTKPELKEAILKKTQHYIS